MAEERVEGKDVGRVGKGWKRWSVGGVGRTLDDVRRGGEKERRGCLFDEKGA